MPSHETYIPTSLLMMRPMNIAVVSSPRAQPTLYQRYRQRTPIIIAFMAAILVMVIHSLPRRKALVKHHENSQAQYDVFDGGSDESDIGMVGGEDTPLHDMPWKEGEIPSGSSEQPMDPIDAKGTIESATSVPVSDGSVSLGEEYDDLPYLHCGPTYGSASNPGDGAGRELILLHGAAFRAETWRKSGILEGLCLLGKTSDADATGGGGGVRDLSVTALDLPVSADGIYLSRAFKSLWTNGILSGETAFFVTPSASGASLVNMATLASRGDAAGTDGDGEDLSKLLRRIVRGWIPVASFAVLRADVDDLRSLVDDEIPILAIYGDKDSKGKDSSERLADLANAWTLELEGKHPCYLDSPDAFVKHVVSFIDNGGSVVDDGQ